MTETTNLHLTKDAETDYYSVARVNANSDKIDAFAGQVNTALSGKATPADITSAIGALNAASVGGTGKYISAISETGGVISATASQIDYTSLINKPQINSVTLTGDKSSSDLGLASASDISGKADKATTLSGYGITDAKITSGTITLGSDTITPLTQHQDISGKADKATTLSGYGITDAKIESGTITLGSSTITPLTQHQDISGKADKVEQEKDRAALIEIVDSGAKNLSQWNAGTGSGTIGSQIPFTTSGNLVVSFQSDISTGHITLGFKNASDDPLLVQQINNSGTKIQEITLPSGVAYFNVVSSVSANYTNFMICTKAAWDISHAYQPYRPSYQQVNDRLVALSDRVAALENA